MGSVASFTQFYGKAFQYSAADGESVAASNLSALAFDGGVSDVSVDGDDNLLFTQNHVDYTVPDGSYVLNSDVPAASTVMDAGSFASHFCIPVSSPATAIATVTVTLS